MFVYVNDLAPIVRAIARVLAPDGVLACTVESHTGSGVKLLPTLRFAYGEDHLRAIIEDAGLSLVIAVGGVGPHRKRRSGPGLGAGRIGAGCIGHRADRE